MRRGIIQELDGIRNELRYIRNALESLKKRNQPIYKELKKFDFIEVDPPGIRYFATAQEIAEAMVSTRQTHQCQSGQS